MEAWPSREIGHPCPEILVPFLEDENLLTGLETLHIWIELLAYEGLYSIVHSLSVEASHRQLSVWYGIDSALPSLQQSGEPARITAPGGSDYRCPRSSCFWANEKGGSRSLWFHVDRQLFSAWPVCLSQSKWQVLVSINVTRGVVDCWVGSFFFKWWKLRGLNVSCQLPIPFLLLVKAVFYKGLFPFYFYFETSKKDSTRPASFSKMVTVFWRKTNDLVMQLKTVAISASEILV